MEALAYFITFRTHGSWLHGDDRGSMDRNHNAYEQEMLRPNRALARWERSTLTSSATPLDAPARAAIAVAIEEVCRHRIWTLLALNVWTEHVHAVVAAPDGRPEHVMRDFKAYATRRLVNDGLRPPGERVWSRHGSTVYIWSDQQLATTIAYVLEGQGSQLP